MTNCIFCKIINQEVKSKIVYQDDKIIAFHDINRQSRIHILIIPKHHIDSTLQLTSADQDWLGHMIIQANKIATQQFDLHKGYKLQINSGSAGGQEIYHLHLHLLGK